MKGNRYISFDRLPPWLGPLLLSTAFGLLLACCLGFSSRFPFAYPEREYLNLLYAKVLAGRIHFWGDSLLLLGVQSVNPVAVALVWIADCLPVSSLFLLWMMQTALAAALIFRAWELGKQWIPPACRLPAALLFVINPWFWQVLVTSPTQVLLAWLLIEYILQSRRTVQGRSAVLVVLALCGVEGFLLALVIVIHAGMLCLLRDDPSGLTGFSLCLASLLPAFVFYMLQSLRSGVLMGGGLIDYPSLFSAVHSDLWFDGRWSEQARGFLTWLGSGGAPLLGGFPWFGLFALVGIIRRLADPAERGRAGLIILLFTACLLIFSFSDMETIRYAALPLFFFLVASAAWGLEGVAAHWPAVSQSLVWILAAALSVPPGIQSFSEGGRLLQRSTYYHDLAFLCSEALAIPAAPRLDSSLQPSPAAVRFLPSLYVHLPSPPLLFPLGLSVRHSLISPEASVQGIRLGWNLLMVSPPQKILAFHLPDSSFTRIEHRYTDTIPSSVETLLDHSYHRISKQQLFIYTREEDATPVWPWVEENRRLLAIIRASAARDLALLDALGWNRSQDADSGSSSSTDPFTVGLTWNFETDLANTHSVGYAFGSSPKIDSSAEGLGSAASGSDAHPAKMGTLQSLPFLVEGDDLSFYAHIPQSATMSLFCVAVKQFAWIGESSRVKRARHIFEHRPGDPLMGDTFYYVQPSELHYEDGRLYGWRVIHVLYGEDSPGWQYHRWSLNPWQFAPAIWFAADHDPRSWLAIDQVAQRIRPPGRYWNFEGGHYDSWLVWGSAFGRQPAIGPFGEQQPIHEFEGNYFVNTFFEGIDEAAGVLATPPFLLDQDWLSFLIGGGRDPERIYLELKIDGRMVLRETGDDSETMRRVIWDVTAWKGRQAEI